MFSNLGQILALVIATIAISCTNRGAMPSPAAKGEQQDLPKQFGLSETNVYLSMTTSPERIKLLPVVLQSLDLEGVEKIYLNLPKYYRDDREKGAYSEEEIEAVKNAVEKMGKTLVVQRTESDTGPNMKLLPTLRTLHREGAKGTVVTIDDDTWLGGGDEKMFFDHFKGDVHTRMKLGSIFHLEGNEIPSSGWSAKARGLSVKGLAEVARERNAVQSGGKPIEQNTWEYLEDPDDPIVLGFGGVAYPLKLVTQRVANLMEQAGQLSPECKYSDDMAISAALKAAGITILPWSEDLQKKVRAGYTATLGDADSTGLQAGHGEIGGKEGERYTKARLALGPWMKEKKPQAVAESAPSGSGTSGDPSEQREQRRPRSLIEIAPPPADGSALPPTSPRRTAPVRVLREFPPGGPA